MASLSFMSCLDMLRHFLTASGRLLRPYEAMVPFIRQCHLTNPPLSIEAWLAQTTEFMPADSGSHPHIGLPITGWTVGMEPLASPI